MNSRAKMECCQNWLTNTIIKQVAHFLGNRKKPKATPYGCALLFLGNSNVNLKVTHAKRPLSSPAISTKKSKASKRWLTLRHTF
jgi:hypothetical protein